MKISAVAVALSLVGGSLIGCAATEAVDASHLSATAIYEVVRVSDVEWEQLNPARGDQSPQAGALWGNRTEPGAAGFLLKPIDGFRSPPHIHNVAYRGVVISDLIHNDDPGAADMWMGTGSFWTQPAGEIHITAAVGEEALAYIEIEDSFGVYPPEEQFETDERAVNVDASNIVWLTSEQHSGLADGIEIAWLWGSPADGELNGSLLKMRPGLAGTILTESQTFHAVVIQGEVRYSNPMVPEHIDLEPGSLFSSEGSSRHALAADPTEDTILYVRTGGRYAVMP